MQQAGLVPGRGHLHGAGDVVLGDAVQRGLLLVHQDAKLRLVVFHVPVHIHHAIGALPEIADAARDGDPLLLRRPVDLGHQRLEHRRAGGNLGHLDARPVAVGNGDQALPHLLGDLVALQVPLLLGQQIDLHDRPCWDPCAGSNASPGR